MNNKKILAQVMKLIDIADTVKGKKRINQEFPRKIKTAKGIHGFVDKLKKLYRYFQDPLTSKAKKGLIGAALLYFIMPFDVVHDFIPLLGFIDDGVAIALIWSMVEKELKNYEENGHIIDITSEAKSIDEDK